MAGNVWEWTSSVWEVGRFGVAATSPNEWDPILLRGGSFGGGRRRVRCAYRNWNFARFRNHSNGFRCVRDVPDAP